MSRAASDIPALLVLFLVLLLALLLRLLAVWQLGAPPSSDGLEYHSIAVNLVSGAGYFDQWHSTTARDPAYPVFLAALYALFGTHYRYALLVQAVLQAGMVVPVFFLTRRLSGSREAALLAALLFAVYPAFEIVTLLYTENLQIILLICFLWAACVSLRTGRGRTATTLAAGLSAGVLALTKPELALLTPFMLLLCLAWRPVRRYWRRCVAMAAIALLLAGTWQMREWLVGEPTGRNQATILTETILYSSAYPAHTGSWWWPVTDMHAFELELAQAERYRHGTSVAEMEKELYRKLLEHPLGYLKLSLSRLLILWVSPPVGSSMLDRISPVLRWVALVLQWLFVLTALAMLLHSLRRRPELLPFLAVALYWTGVYSLTSALRRYSYPLVAEECVLAAWALIALVSAWEGRRLRRQSQ